MIPARLTVAGDALARCSTSKSSFMCEAIGTRSPLAKVKTRLSSRTVLRFSIQMASTGPSRTIQTEVGVVEVEEEEEEEEEVESFVAADDEEEGAPPPPPPPPEDNLAALLHSAAKTPSVQSPVAASIRPNICGAVSALGLSRQTTVLRPSAVSAAARHSTSAVLPLPEGPTSMMPCLTRLVS